MGPPQMSMSGMAGPPSQQPKPLFPSAVVVSIYFYLNKYKEIKIK